MKRHIKEFIKAMDDFLRMEGKLVENLLIHEHFAVLAEDEVLSFERFYDLLSK